MTERRIDEAEARRILEDLARNGPPTAKVASIKVLLELDKAAAEAEPTPSPFDQLYDVEDNVAHLRRKKRTESS